MVTRTNGFTLVEMSVVLVVIGLIVGAVALARAIIHQAELRRVVGEEQSLELAIQMFRLKYQCLPGDCRMDDMLGAQCGDATSDPDTGCNGTADGTWWNNNSVYAGELLKVWMHLAQTGMLSGSYSGRGVPPGMGPTAIIGINIPRSSKDTLGWNAGVCDDVHGVPDGAENAFCLGGPTLTAKFIQDEPVLSFGDAERIDRAIDDGRPAEGRVRSNPAFADCGPEGYFAHGPPEAVGCNLTFFW